MPGVFYSAQSPDKPPFVNEGDQVKTGQTLCIIESMKIMNEIESEKSGTIKKILLNQRKLLLDLIKKCGGFVKINMNLKS